MTTTSFPRWVRALCMVSLVLVVAPPAAAEGSLEVTVSPGAGPCKIASACSCPLNPQDYLFRLGDYIEECRTSG